MTGKEFLKRLRRLSKASGITVRYDGKPGKGSHGRVYYGGTAFTTIKDLKKEIGPRPVEQDARGPSPDQG